MRCNRWRTQKWESASWYAQGQFSYYWLPLFSMLGLFSVIIIILCSFYRSIHGYFVFASRFFWTRKETCLSQTLSNFIMIDLRYCAPLQIWCSTEPFFILKFYLFRFLFGWIVPGSNRLINSTGQRKLRRRRHRFARDFSHAHVAGR